MTIYHSWYDNNAFLRSLSRRYYAAMKTNNTVALITGANRGLGLQTARELGKLGITLLLGVRDASKSQEALHLDQKLPC
jgi:hypothetical protein